MLRVSLTAVLGVLFAFPLRPAIIAFIRIVHLPVPVFADGDLPFGAIGLTASAGMAGLSELAAAALQELKRAQPDISLAWIAEQMPIRHDAEREHYLEGFRRAGLE